MNYEYTTHAKNRMSLRGIKKKQIELAIQDPEIRLPAQKKRRVMKRIDNKTLDVIYKPLSQDKIRIITAVWLRAEDRKVRSK